MPSDRPERSLTGESGIDRRNLLQAIGAASTVSLAGCPLGGGGDGDGGDGGDGGGSGASGERVPTMQWIYLGGGGALSSLLEQAQAPLDQLEELGIDIEYEPVEAPTLVGSVLEDQRTYDVHYGGYSPTPDRIDPETMIRRNAIDFAGANGLPNQYGYASCEYSEPAIGQVTATTAEERQEMVDEAVEVFSSDLVGIPTVNYVRFTAASSDRLDIGGVGEEGMTAYNPNFFIQTEATGDDVINASIPRAALDTRNFPTKSGFNGLTVWNRLVHSPLVEYDENLEIQNTLASSIETADDGTQITVELEDATFHNGDPITAEDVQYTFELLTSVDAYPQSPTVSIDSIEVVDETTAQFNFPQPALTMVTKHFPMWGIFHRDTWESGNAGENPGEFDFDPMVGSGPYQAEGFEAGSFLELSPHDGHPRYDVSSNVFFQAFGDETTTVQAFESGEIDVTDQIGPSSHEQLSGQSGVRVHTAQGATTLSFHPNYPTAPTKFRAFRNALGTALDRQFLNELTYRGEGTPQFHPLPLAERHPWVNEDVLTTFTDEPSGDMEAARGALEEAGWGWDSNDNLHYPEDADLSPLWPEGETPSPEDFPCLEDMGGPP